METTETNGETDGAITDSGFGEPLKAATAQLVIAVGDDELLGLRALLQVSPAINGESQDLEDVAADVMRWGLAARLGELGIRGAASAVVFEQREIRSDAVSSPSSATGTKSDNLPASSSYGRAPAPDSLWQAGVSKAVVIWRNKRLRAATSGALAITILVLLLGGYAAKWSWTGFQSNDQLWDWLQLLLLPVAVGTVPVWLKYGEHMSHARKVSLGSCVLLFAGFVVAGYLVPLSWTGFRGNSLWNWLTLAVLPVAVVMIGAWPSLRPRIRSTHVVTFCVIGVAWLVTLVGGYAATWRWTGYPGNTLWDWLQLMLAPLVITTILVPRACRWLSGDVARVAEAAEREKSVYVARRQGTLP